MNNIEKIKKDASWNDVSVNFWTGCKKVSTGCKFCYMFRMFDGKTNPNIVRRTSSFTFEKALFWKKRKRIFTCSISDFFIEEADEWRKDAWDIIKRCPQHEWQILTKRPERIMNCLPTDWGNGYTNVWLGVSIASENRIEKERLKYIADVKKRFPGVKIWISAEPLISDLDFTSNEELRDYFSLIDWMVIGGESGYIAGKHRCRPCKMEWIENIIWQCREFDIPVFVRQVGSVLARENKYKSWHGEDINEFPEILKVREFPDRLK